MKNILLVLSEGSSIDKETGQWSILNIIENFNIKPPKEEKFSIRGKFDLVSFWGREEVNELEEFRVIYKFIDKEGNVLIETPEIKFSVKEGLSTVKHRLRLSQIPLKGEGRYYFQALKKENGVYKKVSQTPINVKIDEKDSSE